MGWSRNLSKHSYITGFSPDMIETYTSFLFLRECVLMCGCMCACVSVITVFFFGFRIDITYCSFAQSNYYVFNIERIVWLRLEICSCENPVACLVCHLFRIERHSLLLSTRHPKFHVPKFTLAQKKLMRIKLTTHEYSGMKNHTNDLLTHLELHYYKVYIILLIAQKHRELCKDWTH